MTPYTHGGDVLTARARFGGDVLDCSANLNPLGMPPAVQAAAAAAAADSPLYSSRMVSSRVSGFSSARKPPQTRPATPTPCAAPSGRPSPPTTGWRRSRCSAAAGRRS